MKTIFLLCGFLLCSSAFAVEYFVGTGHGWVPVVEGSRHLGGGHTGTATRTYSTAWINDLLAEVRGNPKIAASTRANAFELIDRLTQQANDVGMFGLFTLMIGDAQGGIEVRGDPDHLLGHGGVPGTAFTTFLWLEVPEKLSITITPSSGARWSSENVFVATAR